MISHVLLDRLALLMLAQADPTATDALADPTAMNPADLQALIEGLDRQAAVSLAQQYGVPMAQAIVVMLIAIVFAGWMRRVVIRVTTRAKIEITLAKFFGAMTKWGILLLAGIVILGVLGIETASFAIVLGAMGFAIGMAMQGSLGNLAAGVMLLIFRPFKVGQTVNVAGVSGLVDEIGLFSTIIDTFDNRRFVVPNGSIFGSVIENKSHHATRRVSVSVGIEYSAPIDTTRDVLLKAAKSLDNILEDPEPSVVLGDLGDSSVNWTVRVWCNRDDYWGNKQLLTRAVKMHLDESGIGIPFPQMDVHLDKGE